MEGTERTGVQKQWEEGHCSIPNPHTAQRTSLFRKKEKLGFRFGGSEEWSVSTKEPERPGLRVHRAFPGEERKHLRLKSDQRPGQLVLGRTCKSTVLGMIVHIPCHAELRMCMCVGEG